MTATIEEIANKVFGEIESVIVWIANHIDAIEAMDDFALVDIYTDIENLNSRSSFLAVTEGIFALAGDDYDPTGDEYRGYVRRYEQLTKHHPANAYRRFRAIADRMDDKWTAVEAVLNDRKDRAASGGKTKAAKSPVAKVKEAARNLWPQASRLGWTAVKFHSALVDGGNPIPFDTARKWLTSLRKTGDIK